MVSCITLTLLVAMASVGTASPILCHCPIMPIMADPVCASNGETYIDDCHFKCFKANSGQDIVKVHDGECDSKFHSQMQLEHSKPKMCICTMEFSPVCGSNHHTYSNKCALECDARTDSSLKMLHRGRCSN